MARHRLYDGTSTTELVTQALRAFLPELKNSAQIDVTYAPQSWRQVAARIRPGLFRLLEQTATRLDAPKTWIVNAAITQWLDNLGENNDV